MDSQGTCEQEGIVNGTCAICPPSLLQSGQCGPSQYHIDYLVQVRCASPHLPHRDHHSTAYEQNISQIWGLVLSI